MLIMGETPARLGGVVCDPVAVCSGAALIPVLVVLVGFARLGDHICCGLSNPSMSFERISGKGSLVSFSLQIK